jgi:hypothetical protein
MKKISLVFLIAFSIFNMSCSGFRIALLDTKFPLEEYILEGSGTNKMESYPMNLKKGMFVRYQARCSRLLLSCVRRKRTKTSKSF